MSLSRAQSLILAAVVEDCSHQLDILGHTLTVQRSRMQGAGAVQERVRLTKAVQDCQYISQQMSKLHLELAEKQSFSSLLQAVADEQQEEEAQKALDERRQALQRQKEELQQKTEKLKEMSMLHGQLSNQLSKAKQKKETKEGKSTVKSSQIQTETSKAEKLLEEQLEMLQKKLKDEMRCHEVAMKFLQNQHEELQQQLREWQQRTDQMLKEKQHRLNSVCNERALNSDRLMEMRRKFREMELLVIEDREEQEKLRQQQAEATAATKLQAWWRGCMVRKGLGPFKRAEDDKKGKKKKDKKKKKK
ncbi:dynein regulatory complex protein 9 [Mugil cephalus]|uniref:dynein regulatory complex protein 9 n=1 Tax=Mugil cephalus TaxID=48193 RepID=UPI001FB5AEC7|nr:dynein regulatory complex protein 9 [Mugil cephalus]